MAKIVVWQGLQPNKSNPYLLKSFDYFLKCLLDKAFMASPLKCSLEAALQAIYGLIFTLSNTNIFLHSYLITCITVLKAINLSPHLSKDSFEKLCAKKSK
jgi:hypothetical protein